MRIKAIATDEREEAQEVYIIAIDELKVVAVDKHGRIRWFFINDVRVIDNSYIPQETPPETTNEYNFDTGF